MCWYNLSFFSAKLGRSGYGYRKEEFGIAGDPKLSRHVQGKLTSVCTCFVQQCTLLVWFSLGSFSVCCRSTVLLVLQDIKYSWNCGAIANNKNYKNKNGADQLKQIEMLFFVFINDWPRLTKLKYFVFVQQYCYWFLLCCRHLYYLEQNLYFGVYLKVYFSRINKYAFLLPTHHLMKQACMFNVNLESGHPEWCRWKVHLFDVHYGQRFNQRYYWHIKQLIDELVRMGDFLFCIFCF